MRLSLDATLLDVAEVFARRSTCSRLAVGAVLARDGRVLSTGYNGAPAGMPHCTCSDSAPCTQSVHAEVNAVAFAARHGVAVEGAALYATHAPCVTCAGVLVNCGVSAVRYRLPFRSHAGVELLLDAGVDVTRHDEEGPPC